VSCKVGRRRCRRRRRRVRSPLYRRRGRPPPPAPRSPCSPPARLVEFYLKSLK